MLDRAFEELADFECDFVVDRFSLYVHDTEAGWVPTRDFALTPPRWGRRPHGLPDRAGHRLRRPAARAGRWLDHLLRMLGHYGQVNGSGQAGAVTYFGFLSVFPILALGVFVVGQIARVYPDIQGQMAAEIDKLLPGGRSGAGPRRGIDLDTLGDFSGLAGLVGLAGVLYSGLGWLSGLRAALEVMFVVPPRRAAELRVRQAARPGHAGLIGVVLMVSVVLSGAGDRLLRTDPGLGRHRPGRVPAALLLVVLGHALGIAASTVLLLAMFRLLVPESHVPRNALVRGALLGAVGFEVLKLLANLLIAQTKGQPAFQAFGIALVLLVWINYFSRLVMYAAAWAYTSPDALAVRTAEATRAPGAVQTMGDADPVHAVAGGPAREVADDGARTWRVAVGAAAVGGAAAWLVRGGRR